MKKNIIVIIVLIVIIFSLVTIAYIYNRYFLNLKDDTQVSSIKVIAFETDKNKIIKDDQAKNIANILENLKYDEEPSQGIVRYTLECNNNETYYIKSDYSKVLKDGKQAEISNDKLQEIIDIISNTPDEILGIEDLPEEISLEQAIENGYFVIVNDKNSNDKIYNKDVLDRFVENTKIDAKNRVEDKIRIAHYNLDGYPTIYDLEYKIFDEKYIDENGEEKNKSGYILTIDATRNNFAQQKFTINDNIPGQYYGIQLIEYPEFNAVSISLVLYSEINNLSDNDEYSDIEITRYLLDSKIINKNV